MVCFAMLYYLQVIIVDTIYQACKRLITQPPFDSVDRRHLHSRMIKAYGDGNPGLLILGLSFGNLDRFKAEPFDTFIKIAAAESHAPLDVFLLSGTSKSAIRQFFAERNSRPFAQKPLWVTRGTLNGRDTVVIALSFAELDRLRQRPLEHRFRITAAMTGTDFDILIFSGRTEDDMAALLVQIERESLGQTWLH